jgi:hypothetical protein
MTAARDRDGHLLGFVVFGPLGGNGRIADLVATNAATQTALVAHAVQSLHASRVHRVSLELLDPRPWSARSLRRVGMLPRGRGPEFLILHGSEPLRPVVDDRTSWYLSIGDTDHV